MTENGGGTETYRPEIPSSAGWATFEARVRGRRFARCVERAHAAIESGALDVAREAVNEARALMPDAPEISELESRIESQPSPSVVVATEFPDLESDPGWPRVIGAMAVLLLLFGLFGFGLAQLYLTRPAQELITASSTAREDDLSAPKDVQPAVEPAGTEPRPDAPATSLPPMPDTRPNTPTHAEAPARPAATTGAASEQPVAPRREIAQPESRDRAAAPDLARSTAARQPQARTNEVRPRPSPSIPTTGSTPGSSSSVGGRVPSTMASAAPSTNSPTLGTPAPSITSAPAAPPIRVEERTEPAGETVAPLPPTAQPEPAVTTPEPPARPFDTPVPASRTTSSAGLRAEESARIRSVLARYEMAYNRLDAGAASSIWPGVDQAALDRAFRGLISQRVSLGLCDITVIGDIGGASCVGKARWEPRVGGGVQTADRHWTFNLRKSGDNWRIEQIRVR